MARRVVTGNSDGATVILEDVIRMQHIDVVPPESAVREHRSLRAPGRSAGKHDDRDVILGHWIHIDPMREGGAPNSRGPTA